MSEVDAKKFAQLRWRCRRGMRELDVVLEKYLEHSYAAGARAEREAFERLLDLQDPQLLAYLMGRDRPADPELTHVVQKLAAAFA